MIFLAMVAGAIYMWTPAIIYIGLNQFTMFRCVLFQKAGDCKALKEMPFPLSK